MFPARLSELNALRDFVEGFCRQAELAKARCLRLNLVLEELFTNTIRHGHGGDCEAPIWVSLAAQENARVAVAYEDTAPPFNPYGRSSPDTTLETRTPGGRGVVLLQRLSTAPDYAYLFGRNCIRLAVD